MPSKVVKFLEITAFAGTMEETLFKSEMMLSYMYYFFQLQFKQTKRGSRRHFSFYEITKSGTGFDKYFLLVSVYLYANENAVSIEKAYVKLFLRAQKTEKYRSV